ncbi:MAG: hypothetical protein M1826_006735 [Phylliscum demangeonii]|nr:MAG: hypothetical protein M1826_006735 [Phylliscum demangeonii]
MDIAEVGINVALSMIQNGDLASEIAIIVSMNSLASTYRQATCSKVCDAHGLAATVTVVLLKGSAERFYNVKPWMGEGLAPADVDWCTGSLGGYVFLKSGTEAAARQYALTCHHVLFPAKEDGTAKLARADPAPSCRRYSIKQSSDKTAAEEIAEYEAAMMADETWDAPPPPAAATAEVMQAHEATRQLHNQLTEGRALLDLRNVLFPIIRTAPLLSMPRGGTARSTNFVRFETTWVARLQLLFDWDDRSGRTWEGLTYRQQTRRLHTIIEHTVGSAYVAAFRRKLGHTIIEHTVGSAYVAAFRRKLGHVASRYLWIVPRFDVEQLSHLDAFQTAADNGSGLIWPNAKQSHAGVAGFWLSSSSSSSAPAPPPGDRSSAPLGLVAAAPSLLPEPPALAPAAGPPAPVAARSSPRRPGPSTLSLFEERALRKDACDHAHDAALAYEQLREMNPRLRELEKVAEELAELKAAAMTSTA